MANLLVVEDDDDVRDLTVTILREDGHRVLQPHEVADGTEIIAEMEISGGLDAREDAIHGLDPRYMLSGQRFGVPPAGAGYRALKRSGQASVSVESGFTPGWRLRLVRRAEMLATRITSTSAP